MRRKPSSTEEKNEKALSRNSVDFIGIMKRKKT